MQSEVPINTALWIAEGVLAALFLFTGLFKVTRPKEKLSGEAWVEDFPQWAVTSIGVLEILAAIGLIVPGLFDVAPALVGWAAVGVIALMIGAAIVHLRRREHVIVIANLAILAVAAFVAWGRLGDYPL